MIALPSFDFEERYRTELKSEPGNYHCTLKELLKEIESESNPVSFRQQLVSIVQLYFDGLCGYYNDSLYRRLFTIPTDFLRVALLSRTDYREMWAKQERVLSALVSAGRDAIGSFYIGEGVDTLRVKEMILPYSDDIIRFGSKAKAGESNLKDDHLRVYKFGRDIPKLLQGIRYDTIVCMAAGGFEPAFLLMRIMEMDELSAVRFSFARCNDFKVKVPRLSQKEYLFSHINGKRVLTVEDIVISGHALSTVLGRASERTLCGL